MGLIKPGHSLPASVLTVGLAGVSADAGAADRASRIREETGIAAPLPVLEGQSGSGRDGLNALNDTPQGIPLGETRAVAFWAG